MNEYPTGRFVGEAITVLESGIGGEPVRFSFRLEDHSVVEVVRSWQDWGFSQSVFKKDFKTRRHRNYFEVRTDRGLHALIYFDRGVKLSNPRSWILYQVYGE